MADIRDVESLAQYLFRMADDDKVKDPYKRAKIHAYRDAFERLLALPTIEAEPIKHGRWISTASTLTGYWHKCSGCGGVAIPYYNGQDILSPYCPWCGARMDEVTE